MNQSRVDKVADTMHRLLWENVLRDWVAKLLVTVPVLGWPVFNQVFLFLVDNYLVEPLFKELSRWGVFTSIDWKTDEQYQAYKEQALALVAAQGQDDWPGREEFKNAARNLIRFHLSAGQL